MAEINERSLLQDCVGLAKGNIFSRIVAPCYDEEIDLDKLKAELANFKPADVVGDTAIERGFSLFMRQIENNVVVHLANKLKPEHKDATVLANLLDGLNVLNPVQGAAPFVHVEVVPKSAAARDKTKVTLTNFDSLKERTQVKLLLRPDKEGRLVNPNTNTIWVIGTTGHYVCVGKKDGVNTLPLAPEDVQYCEREQLMYDKSKVAKAITNP